MEPRSSREADAGDGDDDEAADDRVPRRLTERGSSEGAGEVVRHEHGGQRHHDQEVEEQHPPGHEPGEVVESPPHEGGGAAGLRQRRGSLGIGQRDEQEDRSRQEQDERREAEGCAGDDAERDVQRRRDLAVRDREQRRGVDDALEAAELPGHYDRLCRSSVKRATPSTMKRAPST